MNNTKKCLFCNSDLNEHKIIFYEREGMIAMTCRKCLARYIYFRHGKLASYSLFTQFNHKIYNWTFSSISKKSTIKYINTIEDKLTHEYLINYISGKETLETRHNFELEHILFSIDNTPDITPDNVERKLKTYLLFL